MKVFMWIFSSNDFSVKDIVEISDYEINIDEETNANTLVTVLKKTTAEAEDIVAIKKDNEEYQQAVNLGIPMMERSEIPK